MLPNQFQPKKSIPDISGFDTMPDDALVPIPYAAAVTNQGVSTMWRNAALEEELKVIRLSNRCSRIRVGGIRAYIAKKAAA